MYNTDFYNLLSSHGRVAVCANELELREVVSFLSRHTDRRRTRVSPRALRHQAHTLSEAGRTFVQPMPGAKFARVLAESELARGLAGSGRSRSDLGRRLDSIRRIR